jgi:hypothetical protein
VEPDELPEATCVALEKHIAIAHKQTHAPVENIRRAIYSMLPMLDAEKVSALPAPVAAEMLVHGAMMVLGGIKQ